MGIALAIVGILLIVTGAQNTYAQLGTQLQSDITGANNFLMWLLAIMLVGVLGYIPQLRQFSRWFLALILLAIILAHKGFFSQLSGALKTGATGATGAASTGTGSTTGPLQVTITNPNVVTP